MAVKLTTVPLATVVLHTVPQLTPAGDEEMVPEPVLLTERVLVEGATAAAVAVNVAVTLELPVSATVQAPVPVQAPAHPLNV